MESMGGYYNDLNVFELRESEASMDKMVQLLQNCGMTFEGDLTAIKLPAAVIQSVPSEIVLNYRVFPLGEKIRNKLLFVTDRYDYFLQKNELLNVLNLQPGTNIDLIRVETEILDNVISKYYRIDQAEIFSKNNKGVLGGPDAYSLEEDNEDAEVIKPEVVERVDNIIAKGIDIGASDIHLDPKPNGTVVRYRLYGELFEEKEFLIPRPLIRATANRVKIMSNMDISERQLPLDGGFQKRYQGREVDFRVATLPTVYGEAVTIRLLDRGQNTRKTFDDIGFPEEVQNTIKRLIQAPTGLFLVTGPTGSGKTTTLDVILRCFDPIKNKILKVEDPVEIIEPLFTQTRITAKGNFTFSEYLKAVMRHDPDVIEIGEIRDYQTANVSINASTTGHKVLSSLHTNSAIESFKRLFGFDIAKEQILSQVRFLLGQRLVRKLCPKCKIPDRNFNSFLLTKEEKAILVKSNICRANENGCPHCNRGVLDRAVVWELLEFNDDIREFLERENRSGKEIREMLKREGFKTMWDVGFAKVAQGEISLADFLFTVPR